MKVRVDPLGLSTWGKSASQGWIFLDPSGISETRRDGGKMGGPRNEVG